MSLFFTFMLVVNIMPFMKLSDLALLNNFLDAFVIIRYTTSVTNPLLYTFLKAEFWNAVRRLLPIAIGTNILTIASTKRVRSHRLQDRDWTASHSCFVDRDVILVSNNKSAMELTWPDQ